MSSIEILISGSLSGAVQFARQMGWEMLHSSREWSRPPGKIVTLCHDPDQFIRLRKLVVHVGHFGTSIEQVAKRRVLINAAESCGAHVIPYDLDVDPPAPLRFCLICGAGEPCMWPQDLQPGELGTPCTFDLTYTDMVKLLRKVRGENAEFRQLTEATIQRIEAAEEAISEAASEISEVKRSLKAYRVGGISKGISSVA